MTATRKFCVDCKHHKPDALLGDACHHPQALDMVTGRPTSCGVVRRPVGACKPSALLFEPKEEVDEQSS